MELGLNGLRVLVTAGANGIGLSIARAFQEEGAKVHICDVDDKALIGIAGATPGITSTKTDVSDRGQVSRLFDEALDRLGGLDALINNAGISGPTGNVDSIEPEDWDRTIAINITGQFNCARLAVPHLRASKNPPIVNLSSIAGRLGMARRSPYCASKWAVIGFTKSLSAELGPTGIRVNSVLPGLVEGDRLRRVIDANAKTRGITSAEAEAEFVSYVSMKTMVTPQQIADATLHAGGQSLAKRSRSVVMFRCCSNPSQPSVKGPMTAGVDLAPKRQAA